MEPRLVEWLEASIYFLPHIVFRLFALSIVFAFLGYYSVGVVGLIAVVALCLALPVFLNLDCANDNNDTRVNALLSLVLALIAPVSFESCIPSHRTIMKRTITSTTTILLIVLTAIRILPLLVDPETLVTLRGFCHLNFRNPSGVNLDISGNNVFMGLG